MYLRPVLSNRCATGMEHFSLQSHDFSLQSPSGVPNPLPFTPPPGTTLPFSKYAMTWKRPYAHLNSDAHWARSDPVVARLYTTVVLKVWCPDHQH